MVVGPSGAGKDTLIEYARSRSIADKRFSFARRIVTRSSGIGEENVPMTEAAFEAALEANAFALAWRSHGLAYGVPASLRDEIGAGKIVVVNVSRTALAQAAGVAEHRIVVEIVAPREILLARLLGRQREASEDIAARLARQVPLDPAGASHEKIDNSGDVATAGEQFLALLRRLASEKTSTET
jgi:ribose 1,5-bisphosphokinase